MPAPVMPPPTMVTSASWLPMSVGYRRPRGGPPTSQMGVPTRSRIPMTHGWRLDCSQSSRGIGMPASALDTTSYWIGSTSLPRFLKLSRDERVDVVIVGGGITGLTTAHLTMVTDTRLSELVESFGRDHAQAVWDAGLAAIAQIDAIVRDEKIECDYAWVPGYLHAPRDRSKQGEPVDFEKEAALAVELGFDAELVKDVPLMGGPGVRYEDQARFHPRMYLAGLARAIEAGGGHIYEHTEGCEFCPEPLAVKANGHTITCKDIVLATHNPLVGLSNVASATLFQSKLALYTSYVVGGRVRKGRVPDALFSD